jgi:hypothetical protein
MEMPPLQHELRHHVDHLDFMLYSTQQEADCACAKANLDHFTLLQARGTIKLLAKDSLSNLSNLRQVMLQQKLLITLSKRHQAWYEKV